MLAKLNSRVVIQFIISEINLDTPTRPNLKLIIIYVKELNFELRVDGLGLEKA